MEYSQLAIAALSIICAILGWFARELYGATQSLRKDLATLEIRMSSDYVRYDRLQDALSPIMEVLSEIKQSLKEKMDKP